MGSAGPTERGAAARRRACSIRYGTSFWRIIISTADANSHRSSVPDRVTSHARKTKAAAFAARSPTGACGSFLQDESGPSATTLALTAYEGLACCSFSRVFQLCLLSGAPLLRA